MNRNWSKIYKNSNNSSVKNKWTPVYNPIKNKIIIYMNTKLSILILIILIIFIILIIYLINKNNNNLLEFYSNNKKKMLILMHAFFNYDFIERTINSIYNQNNKDIDIDIIFLETESKYSNKIKKLANL